MTILYLGLGLFFLIHLIPMMPGFREGLVNRLGKNGYRGIFSLGALAGLLLIIWGKSVAPFVVWYTAPVVPHSVAYLLVMLAFILFPASHMPTNIRRFTRHPMLWGIVIWGTAHLLMNGDQASVVLFGGFACYGLIAMLSANARGAELSVDALPIRKDLVVVVAGLTVYAVIFLMHGWLFGYPLR